LPLLVVGVVALDVALTAATSDECYGFPSLGFTVGEALAQRGHDRDDDRWCGTPAAVIEGMEGLGFHITHVYGLTEVYGPAVVCAWHDEWDELPSAERARLTARQGVTYPVLEGLMVADPASLAPVPADGTTLGEIFMRGNIVMKGYLKNAQATEEALPAADSTRATSGHAPRRLYRARRPLKGHHHRLREHLDDRGRRCPLPASGRARSGGGGPPDQMWGETPCAFVTLKPEADAAAEDFIAFWAAPTSRISRRREP
jgi:fatty-acyl-CoA synthase